MTEEWRKLIDQAKSARKASKKFILGLARRKDLDTLFHAAHEEAFERIDCLACANCCKTTSPIFRDVDIDRIASHLGTKPSELTDRYLHIDEDGDWVLNASPCVFLEADNRCRIYDVRPRACREYPHTDRKNMAQILELTYRNTMVCPAVAGMVEKIRQQVSAAK